MTRPLFNECPCGAAISIPMEHPHLHELAGRFEDEHREHRQAALQQLADTADRRDPLRPRPA